LREIYNQFRKYRIRIEPDKCEFLKPELSNLIYIITAEGFESGQKKTEAVVRLPTPEEGNVKAFLG
jgi:hypothetical protein